MCGILGVRGALGEATPFADTLSKAVQLLSHRGPDAQGVWCDEAAGVVLGHARLAILDLTEAGAQPMISASGRFVIAYNGEIYNHLALRRELEEEGAAPAWCGHADTETLLAAIEAWGLEGALKKAVGMFAFALWDRQERLLHLARDRFGEKPLYYGWIGKTFAFASELKALAALPGFRAEVDREALAAFMRFGYVPAPRSIYRGICKLLPGTILSVPHDLAPGVLPEPRAYWSLAEAVERGRREPFAGDFREATDELDRLLRATIREKMISDVPLGAFLSGGIDSSTVVAVMQAESSRPVRTFSIGFHEHDYNEAPHAKRIAEHLGCEHTELYVRPEDALEVIPRLPEMYDEPFADSSQIPTHLVARLTKPHVTVALSGDGGDELFGGYNRYTLAARIWRRLGRLPLALRRALARAIVAVPPGAWDRLGRVAGLAVSQLRERAGDKAHKLAEVLGEDEHTLYRRLVAQWPDAVALVKGATAAPSLLEEEGVAPEGLSFAEWMMFMDALTYLPDDILVKVDRATMAVSLESRAPFLDHRIAEFAWRLPLGFKLAGGEGKRILRAVLARYVPRELFERPKMGFGVPIEHWLRGPLRDWAEDLLRENELAEFFDPAPILQKWREHLAGARNWQYPLWCVLMFQAWRRRWRPFA